MFRFDADQLDYMDAMVWNVSQLWALREQLLENCNIADGIIKSCLASHDVEAYQEYQYKLSFLIRNLKVVEDVMIQKTSDIIEATEFSEICNN